MLVYLDQGDIANLERLAARSPDDCERIIREWNELGCELALSMHHAQETAQLADDQSRQRRLWVLRRFHRVRYEAGGSEKVIRLEILSQLLARLGGYRPSYRTGLQPLLFTEPGLAGFESAVVGSGNLLRAFKEAHDLTAQARAATRGHSRPRSFRRQTKEMIDHDAAFAQMEATLDKEGHSPEVRSSMRRLFAGMAAQMKAAANMRQALERFYGIEGYECLPRVSDDDLARVAVFFSVAKAEASEAAKLFGVPPSQLKAAIPALDPYDCPGLRLEMAISRAQDASSQHAVASDEPDRAHIVFLPYVDLAFADRRTVGFLEQEARKPINGSMQEDISRLKRSAEPAAMIQIIRDKIGAAA